MWKRIQTLYLAIVAVIVGIMPLLNICHAYDTAAGGEVSIKFYEHPVFIFLIAVSFVLTCIALFAFRKRILQIRMCGANIVILAALQIWVIIAFFVQLGGDYMISWATLLPIPCIVLLVLGIKRMAKDEVQYAKYLLAGKYKESGANHK